MADKPWLEENGLTRSFAVYRPLPFFFVDHALGSASMDQLIFGNIALVTSPP